MILITGNLSLHCWQLIWKMTASSPKSGMLTAKLLRAKVGCGTWTPASHQGIDTIATLNKRETLQFSAAFHTDSTLLLQMGKEGQTTDKECFPQYIGLQYFHCAHYHPLKLNLYGYFNYQETENVIIRSLPHIACVECIKPASLQPTQYVCYLR